MGVKGLQTYCADNCSDVCERVNIEHLSQQYQNTTGRSPTIVVDGPSCLRRIYGNNSWVCGGQFKQFVENCCGFVDRFQNVGIKLVFFFDGPTVNEKRETWIQRRKRSIRDIERIFDSLSQRHFWEERFPYQQPAGLNHFARCIFKHLCHCEVHTSVQECDFEIAEFARNNSCFAVMGQDSDFIIYNSAPYYFSAENLDLVTLETVNFNTKALADCLKLSVLHLPLFASLMGNDIIPAEKLKNFHTTYCQRKTGNKFEDIALGVADYIRNFPPVGSGLHDYVEEICRVVFNDISMCDSLHQSILSYIPGENEGESIAQRSNAQTSWEQIILEATSKHKRNDIPSSIYATVMQMPYEASTYMEDFRKMDIPSSGIITRRIRQRLYSVILSECPQADSMEEWCVTGRESLERPYAVPILKPLPGRIKHSGLLTLWDHRKKDEPVMNERWTLLSWIISPKLPALRLRHLQTHLVAPVAALFYMIHEVHPVFLTPEELDLFIVVSVIMEQCDTSWLSKIVVRWPDARAIRLTTLYLRLLVHVFDVNGACGFPIPPQDGLPSNCFDGKLFQHLYYNMKRGHSPRHELRSAYHVQQFWNVRNLIVGE
ncbi:constitutive coactivator of peroxisome proliferator-activated receptor gamma-like [Schistocerca nitens]|uniref:constitutive coactivator of peroxisome proliferator-activated receptor gamma-like n=1 Tax=Schistocerca nitens TaxID=7011 RepID=UPI00211789BD|nr:constitutive coactivator of peroxisome proliferator-activated receptor gamma-like [Schistocerca nitens]XP_049812341.1 constitutive coactivator of peroxisome proliferator-activated receptor gamma-like [Schistocerca nitens]XP_049812342.1 constitutive coactivator of peroxisome proliferator-activated receptor gamma-like [Schistocerca nitens]XP_049812343.1 constitutive coactivator of peroxisome proliferator-activated receptor gamma-like [Schistocerca nitens]XP_049812344.1 constitutive coactivator